MNGYGSKKCSGCKNLKTISEFNKGTAHDGLQAYCRLCQKEHRQREDQRERAKRYRRRPEHLKRVRDWQQRNPDKAYEYVRTSRQRFPAKKHARDLVARALQKGELFQQPCEICGHPKTQAHHDDYSKPLDVRWLCTRHHACLHRKSS